MARWSCSILLLGAALLPAQDAALKREIATALKKARPRLLHYMERAHSGRLGLLCLAAIHDGVPPSNEVFASGMRRLRKARLNDTYDLSLRLMIMAETPGYPNRRLAAKRDATRLQLGLRDGGFNYGRAKGGGWDLSNTQYGALGLRAAISLGVRVNQSVWNGLLRCTLKAQQDDGAFGYREAARGLRTGTASRTAAGIAVLQICEKHASASVWRKLQATRKLKKAWSWFEEFKGQIGDRTSENCYYFHYGLERACILAGLTSIDGKDWYKAGAKMLLRLQKRDGSWAPPKRGLNSGSDVATAFSVLFLRRKFRRNLVAPITGRPTRVRDLLVDADPQTVARAVQEDTRRGMAAVPDLLRALRSAVAPRRRAAIQALRTVAGQDFGYQVERSPKDNRDALKAAELWYLRHRNRRKSAR